MNLTRRIGPLSLAASLLLFGFSLRLADSQLVGPEFRINSTTIDWQRNPAVAASAAGNFVVVWPSNHSYPPVSSQLFGQRFDSAGARLGGEFPIGNCCGDNPALATDASGNFIIAWGSFNDGWSGGVGARRLNSSGNPIGNAFQVNTFTPGYQRYPAVAANGSGNFVVVWESVDQDYFFYDAMGQAFDPAGNKVGEEFHLSVPDGGGGPAVAAGSSGNFLVVWQDYGVLGQRLNSAGSKVGSAFRVSASDEAWEPAVTAQPAGNFVVVWASSQGDHVIGQRLNSAGGELGNEFQVSSDSTNSKGRPSVAADSSGNFLAVWESFQDGSLRGVFGQRFNSAGSKVGTEFRVNSYTTDNQGYPKVAALGTGSFVVVWESFGQDGAAAGIFGQRVSFPATVECTPDGDTLCLSNNRFRVEVQWRNYYGQTGSGHAIPFRNDSGLFWFFESGNLEMLIKVINGCGLNQRYWVYAAATTDVEYQLTVTDTATGDSRQYFNTLGTRAAAITDSSAFATCGANLGDDPPMEFALEASDELILDLDQTLAEAEPLETTLEPAIPELLCVPSGTTLCLDNNRFRIRIDWRDYQNRTGSGNAIPYSSDSGMFWFFDANNIEFLVKVIDACTLNSRYWVYAAATTDVEYTMTVTDMLRDATQVYTNPLGTASPAITDSSAFATCP